MTVIMLILNVNTNTTVIYVNRLIERVFLVDVPEMVVRIVQAGLSSIQYECERILFTLSCGWN